MATETNHITAADHNFILYKGDRWLCTLTFTDENDDPIDLSGAAFILQVRKRTSSTETEMELTEGNGLTVGGDDDNVVTIDTLADLDRGAYVYDLQATFSASNIVTYLKGTVTVTEDVTR